MSLGNGNPKHGDKGSNFDFEHRVLKGMTAIAEAMENTPHNYGLFSQTQTSTPVAATTTEGSIIGTGVGQLSVPADGFSVADSFHLKAGGHISCANGEDLRIRIKTNGIVLADTGTMTLNATSNDFWEIEADFVIRQIGGAGVAQILSNGQFVYVRSTNLNYDGSGFNTLENTNFDTTVLNTLEVTAEWGTNNAANTIVSDVLTLIKTF